MTNPASPRAMATRHRAVAKRKDPRLKPPSGLPEAQLAVWRQTVDPLPPDWFSAEHEPLLLQYVNHVCRAAQLELALSTLDPVGDFEKFDKLTKLAALESGKIQACARAMRLTQQSRLKSETASSQSLAAAYALRINNKGGLLAM